MDKQSQPECPAEYEWMKPGVRAEGESSAIYTIKSLPYKTPVAWHVRVKETELPAFCEYLKPYHPDGIDQAAFELNQIEAELESLRARLAEAEARASKAEAKLAQVKALLDGGDGVADALRINDVTRESRQSMIKAFSDMPLGGQLDKALDDAGISSWSLTGALEWTKKVEPLLTLFDRLNGALTDG